MPYLTDDDQRAERHLGDHVEAESSGITAMSSQRNQENKSAAALAADGGENIAAEEFRCRQRDVFRQR